MTTTQTIGHSHYGTLALIAIIMIALFAGSFYAYTLYKNDKAMLESQIGALNVQNYALREQLKNQSQVVFENISLAQLYDRIKSSVVMIRGFITSGGIFTQTIAEIQGSGFVYNYSGRMVIITNNHVVDGVSNISVTFINGTTYAANVLGTDVYVDLAVLEVVNAPANVFKPLPLAFSSTLKVGDTVIAVGNPYKLAGSMTTGIVSQLGRTITENTTNYAIANIIQFDAPINPGNSGGPLLNSEGQVVGITTAIVQNSQGLGFAIPSNAIIREISYLINLQQYTHPWLGVQGTDMDYYIANAMNINITYGFLLTGVTSGGPADTAGLRAGTQNVQIEGTTIPIGGDIIIAMNGTRIINYDALSSYLEENATPENTINLTIKRDGISTPFNVTVTLEARPPP
ncbi:MAG TPA: trypsin-like peptidase domain-containing protein [Candidatus Krumholzibacteriaceae bacterium]|jgi:S1-C subfamily serine protease|nr:trypsin-like peptidase domain-containing protein [Candidatus Krumholzibacteriaceae bacterium]